MRNDSRYITILVFIVDIQKPWEEKCITESIVYILQ